MLVGVGAAVGAALDGGGGESAVARLAQQALAAGRAVLLPDADGAPAAAARAQKALVPLGLRPEELDELLAKAANVAQAQI